MKRDLIHGGQLDLALWPIAMGPTGSGTGGASNGRTQDVPRTARRRGQGSSAAEAVAHHHQWLITVPEAAAKLSISERMVFKLIAKGRLPTVRLGRATRIDTDDVAAFIDAHKVSRAVEPTARPPVRPSEEWSVRNSNLPASWPTLLCPSRPAFSPRASVAATRKPDHAGSV